MKWAVLSLAMLASQAYAQEHQEASCTHSLDEAIHHTILYDLPGGGCFDFTNYVQGQQRYSSDFPTLNFQDESEPAPTSLLREEKRDPRDVVASGLLGAVGFKDGYFDEDRRVITGRVPFTERFYFDAGRLRGERVGQHISERTETGDEQLRWELKDYFVMGATKIGEIAERKRTRPAEPKTGGGRFFSIPFSFGSRESE